MSPIKGTDYQKAVQSLIKRRPAPGRHSALNSLRHISKAWDLRDIDLEMAVFRCCCAEEEAATAIFHALRRLRYRGAERLSHRNHVHKLAVSPFLWVVNKAFTVVHRMGFQPTVTIEGEKGHERLITSFRMPGSTDRFCPMPPLHFSLSEGESPYRFDHELEALKKVGNVKTMVEYVRKAIDNRNRILYASGSGHPVIEGDVGPFIQGQLENVTKLLTIYLLIDMYPQHQLFVQQCLDVFISFVVKIPEDPMSTEGSAT